jgi:hypothetical protein
VVAKVAVDLGVKGPEPGSGGHAGNAGTKCDDGKGKGASGLVLVAPPQSLEVVVAPDVLALALLVIIVAVVVPTTKEGNGMS